MDTMEERTAVLRALAAGDLTVDEADARLAALDAPPPSADPRAGRSDGRRPGRPSVDEVIALAAHGVDAEFVRGLRQAGYDHLTTDEVIALADHGVDLDTLVAFRRAGLEALTTGEMIALVDHGVDPDGIVDFHRAGLRPSVDELIALADHGVDAEWLVDLPEELVEDLEVAELIALADHGVEPEDIRAFLDLRRPGDDGGDADEA